MNKTGVHYTPDYIAEFIAKKICKYIKGNKFNVLEPCIGEGVFVDALHNVIDKDVKLEIDAVEINKETCTKVRNKFSTLKLRRVNNTDFLKYNTNKRYSLIIGNPPYVNKRYMTNEQVKLCSNLAPYNDTLFPSSTIINLWTAFIIKSCNLLNNGGVIAFLLPSDLAHVHHASPLKKYLSENFCRIEFHEIDKVVFSDADQNAIILIAIKQQKNISKGIYHSNVYANVNNHSVRASRVKQFKSIIPNKWTNFGLNKYEIDFLTELRETLFSIGEYCNSSAGIVTAANDYFILSDKDVSKYGLRRYVKPIIQKAAYINGSVTFTGMDWEKFRRSNKPCYLLDFSIKSNLSAKAIEYISIGKSRGIDKRFKCVNRDTWYNVPNINTSEGFFFKRSHLYPKLIKNDANIFVTDSAYKIKMINGYELNNLIFSFYNSLSFVFSEIIGRQYAGGVLELTPSEFRNIPLPYIETNKSEFIEFKNNFSKKINILEILNQNNKVILREGLGLRKKDIKLIDSVLEKLTTNRIT